MSNPIVCGEWIQWFDEKSNKHYYHNSKNNIVTWIKPNEFDENKAIQSNIGSNVQEWWWLPHNILGYVPATYCGQNNQGLLIYKTSDGQEIIEKSHIFDAVTRVALWNDFNDLVNLDEISAGAILHQLKKRYTKGSIYTSIGSILLSVNPYQQLPIYHSGLLRDYKNKPNSLPPHIYKIASQAYSNMMQDGNNQAVVISGESGSGKTEATKLVLQFLSEVTRSELTVAEEILNSNPVLEAFGNAKTIQNNNSSRFGKWVEIFFDKQGRIYAAQIINYLLEKSRVVTTQVGERNYHIFYQLLNGLTLDECNMLKLSKNPLDHHFLNQSQCVNVDGINDTNDFRQTCAAMKSLNFTDDELSSVWCLLAALLHLGNLKFENNDDKAYINDCIALNMSARLLNVGISDLRKGLCYNSVIIAGETADRPFNVVDAISGRNALVKSIYSKLFEWLVERINTTLNRSRNFAALGTVGILDIFGFETFETNSLEQFLINFANEKLQQHFNSFIFKQQQDEYSAEGLGLNFVEFKDNQACLNLIENSATSSQIGILKILDDDSNVTTGSDESFITKLHNRFGRSSKEPHTNYGEILQDRNKFIIHHFAGSVTYDIKGFVNKNSDRLHTSLAAILHKSENILLRKIFNEKTTPMTPKPTYGTLTKNFTLRAKKRKTLGGQFKVQLQSLYDQLVARQPHFVRCIKPNSKKAPDIFEPSRVLRQIQYAGVLEAVRIRREGFGYRMLHKDFIQRYKVLSAQHHLQLPLNSLTESCKLLIIKLLPNNDNICVGKTKVFMRTSVRNKLNKLREKALSIVAKRIQAWYRGIQVRKLIKPLRKLHDEIKKELLNSKQHNIKSIEKLLISLNELDDNFPFLNIQKLWFVYIVNINLEFWNKEIEVKNLLNIANEKKTVPTLTKAVNKYNEVEEWRNITLNNNNNKYNLIWLDDIKNLYNNAEEILKKANVKARSIAALESILENTNNSTPNLEILRTHLKTAIDVGVPKTHHIIEQADKLVSELSHIDDMLRKAIEAMNNQVLQEVEDNLYELSMIKSEYYEDEIQKAMKIGKQFLHSQCATFIEQAIRGEHQKLCEDWRYYAQVHCFDDLVIQCDIWLEKLSHKKKVITEDIVLPTPKNQFNETITASKQIVNKLIDLGYERNYAENVCLHIDPTEPNAIESAQNWIKKHPFSPPNLHVSVFNDPVIKDQPKPVLVSKKVTNNFLSELEQKVALMSPRHINKQIKNTTTTTTTPTIMNNDEPPPRPPSASFARGLRKSMANRVSLSSSSIKKSSKIKKGLIGKKRLQYNIRRLPMPQDEEEKKEMKTRPPQPDGAPPPEVLAQLKNVTTIETKKDDEESIVPPPPPSSTTTTTTKTDNEPPTSSLELLKKKNINDDKTTSEASPFKVKTKMMFLGNYVEDLNRYCVFLVMRDQFPLEKFPLLRPLSNYTKRNYFSKKSKLVDMHLSWQKDDIPRSLIRLSTKMCGGRKQSKKLKEVAKSLFSDILKFMGDRFSNFSESNGIAVLSCGIDEPLLRDEIFCQLMKQLTDNPTLYSQILGWKLMWLATRSFSPSDQLYPYLLSFYALESHSEQFVRDGNVKSINTINDLATHCYFGVKSMLRKKPICPSLTTVQQLCEGDLPPPELDERYLLDLSESSHVGNRTRNISISASVPPPPPQQIDEKPPQPGHRHQMSWSLSISILPPPPPPEDNSDEYSSDNEEEYSRRTSFSVSISMPPPPPPSSSSSNNNNKQIPMKVDPGINVRVLPKVEIEEKKNNITNNTTRIIQPPPSTKQSVQNTKQESNTPKTKRIISPPPPAPKKKSSTPIGLNKLQSTPPMSSNTASNKPKPIEKVKSAPTPKIITKDEQKEKAKAASSNYAKSFILDDDDSDVELPPPPPQ